MDQAFNTAWIGFGWGQDIRIDGAVTATDAFTVTVHRARPGGAGFAWTGAPDPDGVLRVRVDGEETASWTAGVLPVSIRIQRGEASGIVADLPQLIVKMPAVSADGGEPLVSDRNKPLVLRLAGPDGEPVAVRLEAGLKGDKGDKGDVGDLTPELVAARDLAVASASSSAADALATAGDRVATANDREQVRADQITVADDRTRTAADRAATAADRAQTTQDRTVVVGLRGETETLRDSASGHRAASQAAATASQANRDATAADRVQTGQDRASAIASAASALANASQTADDRRQTGEDRVAAAASAAAAALYDPANFENASNLKRGAFAGWGLADNPQELTDGIRKVADFNTLPYESGIWCCDVAMPNGPGLSGVVVQLCRGNQRRTQTFYSELSNRVMMRSFTSAGWTPWLPITPERGSNGNGDWVKYFDGTMLCSIPLIALTGGGGATISATWTFPTPFSVSPVVLFQPTNAPPVNTRERSEWITNLGTGSVSLNISMNASWPASSSVNAQAFATGRWY